MNSFNFDIGMDTYSNKVTPSKNKDYSKQEANKKPLDNEKEVSFYDMLKEKSDEADGASEIPLLLGNIQNVPLEENSLLKGNTLFLSGIQLHRAESISQMDQLSTIQGDNNGNSTMLQMQVDLDTAAENSSFDLTGATKDSGKVQVQGINVPGVEIQKTTNTGDSFNSGDTHSGSQTENNSLASVILGDQSGSVEAKPTFPKDNLTDPLTSSPNLELDKILSKDVKDKIFQNIARGNETIEIQLTPKNLGTLDIKVVYDAGKTIMSIICSDNETMKILSQNASELGQIIESNTKADTVVIIDEAQPDYLHDESGGQKDEYHGQQQGDDTSQENHKDNSDFLHMLRLGLT